METTKAIKYKALPNGEPFDPVRMEEIIQSVLTGQKQDERFRKIKSFLYQVRDARRRVEILANQIVYRQEAMEYISPSYSDTPKQQGGSKSRIESGVIEIATLEGRLHKAEENLARITVVVSDAICQLSNVNQQAVLLKRYVDGKTWDGIAAEMDKSVRWVQKLHGRALPLMEEILERLDSADKTEDIDKAEPVNQPGDCTHRSTPSEEDV